MIEDYSRRIKGLKKGIASQGKAVMSRERNKKRAGRTAFRNSGIYVGPNMDPVNISEKIEENKKKEMEDL